MSDIECFKHMDIPPKPVLHSNVPYSCLWLHIFTNYDLISDVMPNNYATNSYRKWDLT